MNILIVANHYPVCSARYAADAFTRLGHNVTHVGPPMGRHIWGTEVPEQYIWEPQNEHWRYEQHDLYIIMDSDPLRLDEWAHPENPHFKTPMVVWGVDNHVRDYRRPWFEHYFLAHHNVSLMPWLKEETAKQVASGVEVIEEHSDMTWLPCAYDPVAFSPSPIPWAQREYDVCCLGVMYDQRWELVGAMRAAGLKVLAGAGLVYDAYRDGHHNSRVALVSSIKGDLPIRLFEGAGMGCAVLSNPIADLGAVAPRTSPVMSYSDVADAVVQAKKLCAMTPEQAAIAINYSLAWVRGYTWDARAQVIIEWLEKRNAA